jgi:hypothetical protein
MRAAFDAVSPCRMRKIAIVVPTIWATPQPFKCGAAVSVSFTTDSTETAERTLA